MQINIQQRLTCLFDNYLTKQSLRRNFYLFNHLSPQLEVTLNTIMKERKVAEITDSQELVRQVLQHCTHVKQIHHTQAGYIVQIHIDGDLHNVRIYNCSSITDVKNKLTTLLKKIKYKLKEKKDCFIIEFQNHQTATQFIEQSKLQSHGLYQYEIVRNDPYTCLKQSINALRKERKNNQKHHQQPKYQQQIIQKNIKHYIPKHHQQVQHQQAHKQPKQYKQTTHQHKRTQKMYKHQGKQYHQYYQQRYSAQYNAYLNYQQEYLRQFFPIFVRRAIQSQDDQPQQRHNYKKQQVNKQHRKQQVNKQDEPVKKQENMETPLEQTKL